jgi:hypothetical protein
MRANFETLHIPYEGNNLKFFLEVKAYLGHNLNDALFRASEEADLWRVLLYGTDRGGYPPKMFRDNIPYEDVIYGTIADDILLGEAYPEKSHSFKKFSITPDPVLLIYSLKKFYPVGVHLWQFSYLEGDKLSALTHVVNIGKV